MNKFSLVDYINIGVETIARELNVEPQSVNRYIRYMIVHNDMKYEDFETAVNAIMLYGGDSVDHFKRFIRRVPSAYISSEQIHDVNLTMTDYNIAFAIVLNLIIGLSTYDEKNHHKTLYKASHLSTKYFQKEKYSVSLVIQNLLLTSAQNLIIPSGMSEDDIDNPFKSLKYSIAAAAATPIRRTIYGIFLLHEMNKSTLGELTYY